MTKQIIPNNSEKINGKTLTQEKLKELLHYDPKTGLFHWKITKKGIRANKLAGHKNYNGYIEICINYKKYLTHRLAFLYMEGYFPEYEVDHINRIRDDNRWKNLRHVSARCNMRNRTLQKNNSSGIAGIYWSKSSKKWECRISITGKELYLGTFNNLRDAAQARWEAEVQYGYPNCNTTSSAYLFLQKNKFLARSSKCVCFTNTKLKIIKE